MRKRHIDIHAAGQGSEFAAGAEAFAASDPGCNRHAKSIGPSSWNLNRWAFFSQIQSDSNPLSNAAACIANFFGLAFDN